MWVERRLKWNSNLENHVQLSISWVLWIQNILLVTMGIVVWSLCTLHRWIVHIKITDMHKILWTINADVMLKKHTEVHMGTYGGIVESTSYTNIRNLSYSLAYPKLVAELNFDTGHKILIDSLLLPSLMARWLVIGANLRCEQLKYHLHKYLYPHICRTKEQNLR